jgi:hypothetical protein
MRSADLNNPPPFRGTGLHAADKRARTEPIPYIEKICSNPDPSKPLTHKATDALLDNELREATLEAPAAKLVPLIFPDSSLPASPEFILLFMRAPSSKSNYPKPLFQGNKWDLEPYSNDNFMTRNQEPGCAALFNVVGALSAIAGSQEHLARIWVSSFRHKGLPGIRAVRRPDVALFDGKINGVPLTPQSVLNLGMKGAFKHSADSRLDPSHSFQTLRASCQVKSSKEKNKDFLSKKISGRPKSAAKALKELAQDAFFTFATQDNRRYSLGVRFCNTAMSLSLFDRSGAIHSTLFDINKHPLLFIRVISGLTCGSDAEIGYDLTINSANGHRYIRLKEDLYEIISTELISDVIRGRGTVVFRVRKDGRDYAMKDSWIDMSRETRETEILEAIKKIPGTPICVDSEVVQVNGKPDQTALIRKSLGLKPAAEIREHFRLLLYPFVSPLVSFQDKIELLSVLRDAIYSKCPSY